MLHFTLENTQLTLGIEADTDKALALEFIPADNRLMTLENGEQVVTAFACLDETETQQLHASHKQLGKQAHKPVDKPADKPVDKLSRIEQLITNLLAKTPLALTLSAQMPVFWLLPVLPEEDLHFSAESISVESTGAEKPAAEKITQGLKTWLTRLKHAFPALFQHPQTQLFPFGRAALPMALASVATLFEEQQVVADADTSADPQQTTQLPGVCIIAVDTLFEQIACLAEEKRLVTETTETGFVPGEGAIFTCITPSNTGLAVNFLQQETTSLRQRSQGVESLFLKVAQLLSSAQDNISTLYLPGNGEADLQQPWLDAYLRLATCLDRQSQIKQTALFTGELGCVTGLYNFLHLYNGFENQALDGNVLQLELADSLYQSIALYSWTGKE